MKTSMSKIGTMHPAHSLTKRVGTVHLAYTRPAADPAEDALARVDRRSFHERLLVSLPPRGFKQ